MVTQGDDVAINCRLIAGSLIEPVHSHGTGPHGRVLSCEIQNQNCWLNLTAVQFSHKIICGKNNSKYWGELDVNVVTTTTITLVMLSLRIFEMGLYVVRRTGQQQILFNPAWSLKQFKLSKQNNVSEIQPACSRFLRTSFEGWTTWSHWRNFSKHE